ncbi:TetR/AcrR family transcriptional regulator C-terminal domain-containing protein [Agromyces badenianii]|uniref:TetR/AcrR family transcriptional regulator C-terminal domain-containing protein n=1 Tax=Agromyces badenianii TaxID=2080742 RepID=UPI000D599E94|nr:TetR/AcrR family transcriptional regulator C-terminal domain-containing protein [Agromyces badenianii]PWC03463.1 TetR family transcriptional regulator [Agromyces badenianii]
MSSTAERSAERRAPLTRGRVLESAVELADTAGIDALTIRRIAERLGVEPMSLYYHVRNKEAILDGAVELVFTEVEQASGGFAVPETDAAWKSSLRTRILAARTVMLRHPWAPGVIDSRTDLGLATARYVDSVVGTLRSGGLSYDLIHHAMHALGSRMFGFTQELGEPDDESGDAAVMEQMAAQVPHLAAMLAVVRHVDPDSTLGWCDDQFEFEFGLDLILDGLERITRADRPRPARS